MGMMGWGGRRSEGGEERTFTLSNRFGGMGYGWYIYLIRQAIRASHILPHLSRSQ